MIMRFGSACAAFVAIFGAAATLILFWGAVGWAATPVAAAVGAFAYFFTKSYVELISIVMEMAH